MENVKMIIYNTQPPKLYATLRMLCRDLGVNPRKYDTLKFPFKINGIEVFKEEVIRGKRRIKPEIKTK